MTPTFAKFFLIIFPESFDTIEDQQVSHLTRGVVIAQTDYSMSEFCPAYRNLVNLRWPSNYARENKARSQCGNSVW